MVNIAERILLYAKNQGVSQTYICAQLGVGRTYLVDAKRGKNRITPARLAKIAEILHTTPEYLMDETDNPDPPPAALPARFEGLSPEKQALINLIMSIDDPHTLHAIRLLLDEIQGYD